MTVEQPEAKSEPTEFPLKLRKRLSLDDTAYVYANEVYVNQTEHEFHLYFGRVTPPIVRDLEDAKGLTEVSIPIDVVVTLPAGLIPKVIKVLEQQWRQHEQTLKSET